MCSEGHKSRFIPAGRGSRPVLKHLARFQGEESAHEAPIEQGHPRPGCSKRSFSSLDTQPPSGAHRPRAPVSRGPSPSAAPPAAPVPMALCPGHRSRHPALLPTLTPALPLNSGPGPLSDPSLAGVMAKPGFPGSHEPAAWPAGQLFWASPGQSLTPPDPGSGAREPSAGACRERQEVLEFKFLK